MKKVVLAYSGGLDTSVAVAWLREQFDVEVVTLTVDLGGGSLRPGVERRAMSRRRLARLRRRRARTLRPSSSGRTCRPTRSTRAPTRWPRPSPGRSSRSCSSRSPAARAPTRSPTAAPARATTRSASTSPSTPWIRACEVVAPMRVGMGLSRDEEIDYAAARGIEVPDHEGLALLDRREPVGPLDRDRRPGGSVGRAAGRRLRVDRRPVRRARAGRGLDRLRGRHAGRARRRAAGSGRAGRSAERSWPAPTASAGSTTSRIASWASRAARSTSPRRRPCCTRPIARWRACCLTKDTLRFNRLVADELARLTYDGLWFSALHRDLRGYVASSQRVVSGEVRMRLDHGSRGRRRPPLAAVAVREAPRHVRHGRRVRPRRGRRLHRDLRPAAAHGGRPPRRRRQAPRRGLGVDRAAARRPADDRRRRRRRTVA